jgi:hypothetical protein
MTERSPQSINPGGVQRIYGDIAELAGLHTPATAATQVPPGGDEAAQSELDQLTRRRARRTCVNQSSRPSIERYRSVLIPATAARD